MDMGNGLMGMLSEKRAEELKDKGVHIFKEGEIVIVSNEDMKKYLNAVLDEGTEEIDPEEILAIAMSDDQSLIAWGFKTDRWDEVDFDYYFALGYLQKELK